MLTFPLWGPVPGAECSPAGLSLGDGVCGSRGAKQEKAFNRSWMVATTTPGELRGSLGIGYPGPPLARVVSLTASIQIIITSA